MRFNVGPPLTQRLIDRVSDWEHRRREWHRWFAWRPVRMTWIDGEVRWLEYVERRVWFAITTDYRPIERVL